MRRGSLAFVLAAVAVLLVPRAVRAQRAPTCEGTDTEVATRAIEEGDRASDRAAVALRRHRAEEAEDAWTSALAAYDRACAAGSEEALERRAIPLFRLGHPDQAAESLDVFLAAHPLRSLDRALARRVSANLRAIERHVATLVITPTPAHAAIVVDGITRGQGLLRVRVPAETNVVIEAHAADHAPFHLASTYGVGEHVVRVDLVAFPTDPEEGAERTAAPETPIVRVTPEVPVLAVYGAPPSRSPGLTIAGIVLSGVGAVLGVAGALFVVESETGSLTLLGDRDLAGILGTTLLVGAGAALTTGIVLLIVDATREQGRESALACTLRPLGLGCLAHF